ncbi:MAG: MFS transporter [Actinomycetota bacterium]|nr:MFS transporter [Actinomycetota bacterium]
MTDLKTLTRQTFSSLANPNYRRYLAGQSTSLTGTWMQTIAQSWLVLTLTGSGTDVGLAVAVQTLPILFLGPYAGVIADRTDKRKLMIALQTMMGIQALVLGVLTVTHVVRVWEVFVLAAVLGLNNAFENPARQSFVLELVGRDQVRNAVSLNSVMVNVARAVGPGVAGLIIASGGIGFCFLLNAASFVAVVISLARLDLSSITRSEPTGRERGQLSEGLRYVARAPALGVPLLMMALIGCFVYEFQVVLPVLAKHDLHGGADTYGFITSAMGIGAIVGGLYYAARGRTGTRALLQSSLLFAGALVLAAVAPNLWTELIAIALVGAVSIGVLSQGNSTLQLGAAPNMRGRVMALWAVAFLGSTPIGGPIAGLVSEHFGGRGGLLLGAIACVLAAAFGALTIRHSRLTASTRTQTTPGP